MTPADITSYLFFLITMTLAPGPLMAVTVARSLNRDTKGALAFVLGIAIGNVFIITFVRAGLGIWLNSMPQLFDFAKILALVYIAWIAYQMWICADTGLSNGTTGKSGLFSAATAGYFACFVSPHYLLFYLLILPGLFDVAALNLTSFTLLTSLTFLTLLCTFGFVIFMAVAFRTKLISPKNTMAFNRCLSMVVASSGVWMAST